MKSTHNNKHADNNEDYHKRVHKSHNTLDRFSKTKYNNNNYNNNNYNNNNNNNNYNNNYNNNNYYQQPQQLQPQQQQQSRTSIFKQIKKKVPINIVSLDEEDREKLKKKKDLKLLEENKQMLTGSDSNLNVVALKKVESKSKISKTMLTELSISIIKTVESVQCYRDRSSILKRLEDVKQSKSLSSHGEIKFKIFGSSSTNLALKHSDIDIVMTLEKELKANEMKNWIYKLSTLLRSFGFEQVKPIVHAKVPIIKFYDPKTNFHCDITLTKDSGNTAVIKQFCELNPNLKTLIIFIKHWASKLNINDASLGTLSSYAISNLLIHIFQKKNLLPSYDKIEEFKQSQQHPATTSKTELAELAIYFFQYYGYQFNFRYHMININDKELFLKETTIDQEEEKKFKKLRLLEYNNNTKHLVNMQVQDQKDLCFIIDCLHKHNITRCIQRSKLLQIIKEFQKSHSNLLTNGTW